MGIRGLFNFAKARNVWNGVKRGVSTVYTPFKKVVRGVANVAHGIDNVLDRAAQAGIPRSLIDLVRDNPIYSTVHSAIETVDDLVNQDLPRLGNVVNDFVEHNVFQSHAGSGQTPVGLSDVAQAGRSVMSTVQRPSFGFTPNRRPLATQALTGGLTS